VIFAGYSYECYSGDALVIYRNGENYYYVSGGHCSCYGLEGQWEPEEYDRETFLKVLGRKIEGGGGYGWETKDRLIAIRKLVEKNHPDQ
jgi:hypothetical protein